MNNISVQEMRKRAKNNYGINFPAVAKYKRNANRIYSILDFEDGEEIHYYFACSQPSAVRKGYAFYQSVKDPSKSMLVNVNKEIY